jgi:thiamine-phosphate pyrophosphorylase
VAEAEAHGAAYVTASPVFTTISKPGYGPTLGADGLAELVASTDLPVIALGGVTGPAEIDACRQAGAAGVAVMGAVMTAADPARTVRALLEEIQP